MSREDPIGCPFSSFAKWGHSSFSKTRVSSELQMEDRMRESAGTALKGKGDMQNEKSSKDYFRTFQLKLSKEFTSSPLLAGIFPAEERGGLQR